MSLTSYVRRLAAGERHCKVIIEVSDLGAAGWRRLTADPELRWRRITGARLGTAALRRRRGRAEPAPRTDAAAPVPALLEASGVATGSASVAKQRLAAKAVARLHAAGLDGTVVGAATADPATARPEPAAEELAWPASPDVLIFGPAEPDELNRRFAVAASAWSLDVDAARPPSVPEPGERRRRARIDVLAGLCVLPLLVMLVATVGTAAQYPAAVALLRADTDRRGGASATGTLGLLAVSGQVTVALGPSLGGVLVGAFGWQAVFLANLPMVALGSALALRALPRGRVHHGGHLLRRLDVPGMAAFTVAMTALMALLLSLTTGVRWWLLPVFLAALAALVWRELRAAEPFLDLRALAGNTALTGTYLRVGLTYTAFYLIFYGLPQWLEQGRRLDVTLTGLVMLPLAAFGAATVLAATRLERRRGPRPLLIIGSAALLLGGLLLAGPLHSGSALWLLVVVSALLGLPNGFNNVGNQTEMFRAADRRSVGAASGLYRTSQYIGANLAAAVLELTFAGPPSDPGLHRMGLVVAAASAVLLTAAILTRRR